MGPTVTQGSGATVFLLRLDVPDSGGYCTVKPAIALVQRCLPAWSVELRQIDDGVRAKVEASESSSGINSSRRHHKRRIGGY